ncbi:T-cell receptor beta chain V region C5 Precursor [Channa argus]|nr:T-cell receptor beta chain V region C5 Precursor [Channa argus]
MQQSLPRTVEEGTEVHISCSHDDSSRPIMLWYQQRKDSQSMALIGFGYGTGEQSYEGDFKEQFELKRESSMKGALIIHRANYSHSAVYFCVASAQ